MKPDILGLFSLPGGMEWLVILIVGLLIFGRRLPEVARSMGRSITEFKRGMKGVHDDIHSSIDSEEGSPRLQQKSDSGLAR